MHNQGALAVRENSRVRVFSDALSKGVQVDSSHATGDLDLFPGDTHPPVYSLTHNLSGNVNVGLNVRNARRGDRMRVNRNSGTPGAFTVTVKSGTAAAGTSIGVIQASANGFVDAVFDGSAWVQAGDAAAA
jgi:hypothetical protein